MSATISKRMIRELIETAGRYCDHPEGEHEPGYCTYVAIAQEDLSQMLDEVEARQEQRKADREASEQYDPLSPPPEPPVGTWVKDRHGGTSQRRQWTVENGVQRTGWGQPGFEPFGKWRDMWAARGPLVECGPWGEDLPEEPETTSVFDDFGGHYAVFNQGREVARWAPGPKWSLFSETIEEDPDYSYTWVPKDGS